MGCPGWDGCCKKVWGACVGCPTWRSCCTKVSDPVCVAANALCRGVRATAYVALEAAKAAYRLVLVPFEAAKLVLEAAKGALKLAQNTFDVAIAALEVGRKAIAAVADIIAKVAGWVFGTIVDVRSITFDADIRIFAKLRVDANASVIFFGKSYNFRITFTLNTKDIIDNLVEALKPGILKILKLRRRRSLDGSLWTNSFPVLVLSTSSKNESENSTSSEEGADYLTESDRVDIRLVSTNVTAELDHLVKDRIEARRQTVDRIAKVMASQQDYNIPTESDVLKPPTELQTNNKSHSIQGI